LELNEQEKRVIEAMKSLNAVSEDKLRTADKIAKAAMMPKGRVSSILINLVNKKIVKRVARQKAAGYYLLKDI
jgi:DNA-binding IclR family transcriptional regulator